MEAKNRDCIQVGGGNCQDYWGNVTNSSSQGGETWHHSALI